MTLSTARLLAVAGAAALALPAAARADAPWSAPAALPGTTGGAYALVTTAAGQSTAISPRGDDTGSAITALSASGAPTGSRTTPLSDVFASTYGQDRLVVLGATRDADGTIGGAGGTVALAFGSGSGALGTPRTLSTTRGALPEALAANQDGVVAAIIRTSPAVRRLVLRRPGTTTFATLTTLTLSRRGGASAVAVGRTGDVLLTWEDAGATYARHYGPTGHAGATHRLGDGTSSHLEPLVGDTGRLSVAWESQRIGEGDAEEPAIVRFATAAPGHGFGPQRLVSTVTPVGPGRGVGAPGVRLVADGDDHALLACEGYEGGAYVVRANAVAAGHLGASSTVSPAGTDSALADASSTAGGAAAVLFRTGVAGTDPVIVGGQLAPAVLDAAVRPAGVASFGAPEVVSGPADDVTQVRASASPDGSRVVSVWGDLNSASTTMAAARPTG